MMAPDTRALVQRYGLDPDTATDYQLDCLAAMLRAEGAYHHAHADFLGSLKSPDGPPEARRAALRAVDGGTEQ